MIGASQKKSYNCGGGFQILMGRCHCCFWPKKSLSSLQVHHKYQTKVVLFFFVSFFWKIMGSIRRGLQLLLDFARMHRELGLSCLPLPKALFEVFFSLIVEHHVLEGSAMTCMG